MSEKLGLYKKIHAVMVASEGLDKSMEVGKGNNMYTAISEKAVLNAIKPLLKDNGLIIIPIEVETKEHISEYKSYGDIKNRFITQVNAKYKIIDIDTGQFEILAAPGNGADSQDKGSGKAWTYAYKAMLQKTFCLFSGEDTDNTHSDDIDKKLVKKPQKVKKVSIDQATEISELVVSTNSDLEKFLKYFKVKGFEELDQNQYKQALKILKDKK